MACWRCARSPWAARPGLVELGVGQGQELLVVLAPAPRRTARRRRRRAAGVPPRPGPRPPGRTCAAGRSSDTATARAFSAAAAASATACQLGRQRVRLRPGVGQASLGQAGRAGRAAQARQVPGNADGKAGREPDDHSEDHGANVTMGCVSDGDAASLPGARAGTDMSAVVSRDGAGSVARMAFKLGGSTKHGLEEVETEDAPAHADRAARHRAAALAAHDARAARGRPPLRAGLRAGRRGHRRRHARPAGRRP